MRLNPYNLTELGDGFGWGSRLIEVVGQSIAIVVVVPITLAWRGLEAVLSRVLL